MGGSLYRACAASILRAVIAAGGAYLVRWGFVDHTLMQDVASALAFLIVDRAWEFYTLHRVALYQKWLLWLGLHNTPKTSQSLIRWVAKANTKAGRHP